MKKSTLGFLLGTGSLLALSAAVPASAQQVGPPAAARAASESVVYLNQAWSQDDREWYYNFAQGSTMMSYDIFLNLEVAGGQELFRSDANSERYGLMPADGKSQYNPDGLPIGLSKTVIATPAWRGAPTGDFVGMTCALCHTGQLRYKGKQVRIDGGINHRFDFMAYGRALDDAIQATLTDSGKFDRLAARLGASSPDAKEKLRNRFEADAASVHHFRTKILVAPSDWGPGRIDALTEINDHLLSTVTGIRENWSTPIAPVKPPFLWNAPQGTYTQWAAFAQDPIGRNLGETMGMFMPINLHAKTLAEGLFASNAAVQNLARVERDLER